ncbi:MAG TPA: SDR family NAD(P)-dependent oxidoreductase, partial [Thermoplasmata archaeon]|nr:SDR family NAD(P)-dependent oxidoreductase [Thermoplasmata archaeon]
MDLGLRGKVALVAAASSGMGLATAQTLAREGCKVGICARNQGPLDKAAAGIRKETGAEVLAIRADMSRASDIGTFVTTVTGSFGGVDLLVPNAGGPPTGRMDALAEEQWSQAFELTFQSAARLIRACLPSMRSRG